jgi:hypothetical protein
MRQTKTCSARGLDTVDAFAEVVGVHDLSGTGVPAFDQHVADTLILLLQLQQSQDVVAVCVQTLVCDLGVDEGLQRVRQGEGQGGHGLQNNRTPGLKLVALQRPTGDADELGAAVQTGEKAAFGAGHEGLQIQGCDLVEQGRAAGLV